MRKFLIFWILVALVILVNVACTPLEENLEVTPEVTDIVATEIVPTLEVTPTREIITEIPERTCTRMSYNINGIGTPNINYLRSHVQRLNPCYILVMDGLGLAQEFHNMGIKVIHRDFSRAEGDEWRTISPQELVWRWQVQKHPDLIRYSTNEPSIHDGNIRAFLEYEIELMRLARERGITVSVGNFGVGRYSPHWIDDGLFDNWLQAVVSYGHIIGVHEYTLAILPFGVGQMPAEYLLDPAKVQPSSWSYDLPTERIYLPTAQAQELEPFGLKQYRLTLEDYEAQSGDMILPPYWHLRRADWFLIRADELGINRPTIVLSEAFWDNMDDVADVRNQLRDRFGDTRGINSLTDIWGWYYPTWTEAQAACKQLEWADAIYPDEYAGFTLFTWSSSHDWANFDFSGMQGGWLFQLHSYLENRIC